MTPLAKAVLVGCAMEAAAAACFAAGGFGPCGPSNPLGFVGLLLHLPSFLAMAPLMSFATLPEYVGTGLMILVQAVLFAAIAYSVFRRRARVRG